MSRVVVPFYWQFIHRLSMIVADLRKMYVRGRPSCLGKALMAVVFSASMLIYL
jgi:hypothetical protein